MFLLVGLGNPGSEYARTRHNVGFMAVDAIVHRYSFSPFQKHFKGQASEGIMAGQKVLALKPETFMNLSGEAVQKAASFYKIPLDNIFVFQDDMDFPTGEVKVKKGGGAAGHNGIKSLDACIGKDYSRIRIGIGRPLLKEDVTDWVTSDITRAEQSVLEAVLELIAQNAPLLLTHGISTFAKQIKEGKNGV